MTSLPFDTSPRSGRVVRKIGGGNSGRKWSGRSKSRSNRVRSRLFLLLDLVDVELREQHAAFGMVRVRQRIEALRPQVSARESRSASCAASSSHVTPLGSFARTPPCTALPRDIVTPWAGLSDRS